MLCMFYGISSGKKFSLSLHFGINAFCSCLRQLGVSQILLQGIQKKQRHCCLHCPCLLLILGVSDHFEIPFACKEMNYYFYLYLYLIKINRNSYSLNSQRIVRYFFYLKEEMGWKHNHFS